MNTNKSILGKDSSTYRIRRQETGMIYDDPDAQRLQIYPAGYTQFSNKDKRNRQDCHVQLYKIAQLIGTQDKRFPFGRGNHRVQLIHEKNNKWDKNAVALHLLITDPNSPLMGLNGCDLGYVPGKISQHIAANIGMINDAKIEEVTSDMHDKYCICKILIAYGEGYILRVPKSFKRFNSLVENG